MSANYKVRRLVALLVVAIVTLSGVAIDMVQQQYGGQPAPVVETQPDADTARAVDVLATLPVKGRAPKTGYTRAQFGSGWEKYGDCDMRNIILRRDLTDTRVSDGCKVLTGTLDDPYTGKRLSFVRGAGTSDDVQIDHVVALSNSWQTGAQQLASEQRHALANDPLNLIAVDGQANQQKSDSDAASWLPSNKAFRCQYVARQIAVKQAYALWVTPAEADAIERVLRPCPSQQLPVY